MDGSDGASFDDFRADASAAQLDVLHACIERLHATHPRVLAVAGGPARVLAFLHRHRFKQATAIAALVEDLRWREKMGILPAVVVAEIDECLGEKLPPADDDADATFTEKHGAMGNDDSDEETGEATANDAKESHDGFAGKRRDAAENTGPHTARKSDYASIINAHIFSTKLQNRGPLASVPKFPVGELEMLGCPLLIPFGFDHRGRLIVVRRVGLWDCDKLFSLCQNSNMPKPVDMIRSIYAKYLHALCAYIQRNSPRCTAGGRQPACVCIMDACGSSHGLSLQKISRNPSARSRKGSSRRWKRKKRKRRKNKTRSRNSNDYGDAAESPHPYDDGNSSSDGSASDVEGGIASETASHLDSNSNSAAARFLDDVEPSTTTAAPSLSLFSSSSSSSFFDVGALLSERNFPAEPRFKVVRTGNGLQSQPHQRTKSIRLRRLFQILAAVIGVEEQHFPGLISVRLVVNADGKFRAGWKSLRKLFKSVSWEPTDPRAAGSLGSASSVGSAESTPSASSTDNATMQAFAWTSQISKVRLLGNSSSKSARRELVEEIGLRCLPVIYGGTCESSPPPVDLQRACNYLMWFEARAAQKREKEACQVLPAGREIVHTIRAASLFTASMAAPLPQLPSAQGAISSRGRPVDGVSMTASEQKEAEPSSASTAPPRSKPARQSGTPHRGSRASPRSSPKTSPQSSPARGTTSGPSAGHALPALSLPSFRPAPVLSAPLDMKTSANKSSPSSQSYSALQHETRRMRVTEGVSANCFKSRGSRTSVHRDRKYRDGYPDDDDDEGHSDEGDTLVDLSDENTRRTSLSSTGDNCRGNSSDEENHDNDFDGNNLDDDMTLGRGAGGCLCCLGLSVLCCRCCSRYEPCKCCNAPKYQFTRLLFRVMGQGWRAQTLSRALSALNTCVIVFSIILMTAGGFMRSSNFWAAEVAGWGLFLPLATIVLGTTIFFVALLGFAGAAFRSRFILRSYGTMLVFFALLLLMISVSVFALTDSLENAIKQSWDFIAMQQADAAQSSFASGHNTTSGGGGASPSNSTFAASPDTSGWVIMSQSDFLAVSRRNTIAVGGSAMAAAIFLAGLPLAWTLQLLGHVEQRRRARENAVWAKGKLLERRERLFRRKRLLSWLLRLSHLMTFAVAVASLAYSIFIILRSGTEETALNAPYLLLSMGVILLFISGWGLIGVARQRPATFALQVVVIGFLVLMLIVFMTLSWADLPHIDALFAGMGLGVPDGAGGGTASSQAGSVGSGGAGSGNNASTVATNTNGTTVSNGQAERGKRVMMMKESVYVVFLILACVMFNLAVAMFVSWALYRVLVLVQKSRVEDYVRKFVQSELFNAERSSLLKPRGGSDSETEDLIEDWVKREIENKRLVVGADELGDDWGSGSGSRMAASGWFEREMLTLEFSAAHDDEIEDKS